MTVLARIPPLRRRLILAGALALLALGLPWTSEYAVPGYYTAGFCTTTYDSDGYGSVYCSPGYIGGGYYSPAAPGFTLDVRVYAALMLLVGFWGLRRRSTVLLGMALAIGVAALVRNPGSQAGQLVWAASLIVATTTPAAADLLGQRLQDRLSRLRRQLRPLRGSRPAVQPPRAAPGATHR